MQKTKIEWTRGPNGEPGYTWNPIKGLCPEGCWFCYARAMYRRFKWDERITEDIMPLEQYGKVYAGSRIFVCSTFELFNEQADPFRDSIFSTINSRGDMTFIILTKRPERIDRPMPPNVWLGVSVTGDRDDWRIVELKKREARVRFVSLEPFLGLFPKEDIGWLDWFIIGRLTGHGYHHNPMRATLEAIESRMRGLGVPLFMKNNLDAIWGGPLIQEYPKEVPPCPST